MPFFIRTKIIGCTTPYHLPPLIQQPNTTSTTYNINHSGFNSDPKVRSDYLFSFHLHHCFPRSSRKIRYEYEREFGTFYQESYGWCWYVWWWRNWSGC